MDYEKIEKDILEERPYNAKKHFLFQLPEIFYFIIKLLLIFGAVQISFYSITKALMEKLPTALTEFCKVI